MRRAIRMFIIVGSALLLGMAGLSQWLGVDCWIGYARLETLPDGLDVVWYGRCGIKMYFCDILPSAAPQLGYFGRPFVIDMSRPGFQLSWWFTIAAWCAIAAVFWRFTRRVSGRAFPVETAGASEGV